MLLTPDDFARLVFEVVEDSVLDGAVWVEPSFYAPHHRNRFGADEEIVDMVLDALHAAGEQLGRRGRSDAGRRPHGRAVGRGRAGAAGRDRAPTAGVVSFGLANDEAIGPPEPFAEAFAIAKEAGLLSTPHAGELAGPESVWGALETLQPDRLQHGVRSIEDPELVKALADSDIVLDVCPTSNLLLSVYPSLDEHPLPQLLEAGIQCSLNGDDPLLFGPVLLHEYELARTEMGLDDDALGIGGPRVDLEARARPTSSRRRRWTRSTTGSRRLRSRAPEASTTERHDRRATSATTATTGSGHA